MMIQKTYYFYILGNYLKLENTYKETFQAFFFNVVKDMLKVTIGHKRLY